MCVQATNWQRTTPERRYWATLAGVTVGGKAGWHARRKAMACDARES